VPSWRDDKRRTGLLRTTIQQARTPESKPLLTSMDIAPDPFRAHREKGPTLDATFQGQPVPMILRHEDVRAAAKDWKTFSSDAPFRVPIPSEEDVRTMRQLPVETDPPDHTEYRAIVEPFFRRAKEPGMIHDVEQLIEGMVLQALRLPSFEVVREFALPLQSRALAHLLNVPVAEADVWIGWGTHVFKDGPDGQRKGAALESYLHQRLDEAARNPGPDFFSALNQATFRGRPLTRTEMLGFANLTFAGGRDTVIHTVASVFAHLAAHPSGLAFLREDPRRVVNASEEYFRVVSPLTHIGRVCPVTTHVHGAEVPAHSRVSLCWASANRDAAVFDAPDEVRLDRKPNPHMAFGAGPHLCLGAAHARLILRSLLESLARRVDSIHVIDLRHRVENEVSYQRTVGYESLVARLAPIPTSPAV